MRKNLIAAAKDATARPALAKVDDKFSLENRSFVVTRLQTISMHAITNVISKIQSKLEETLSILSIYFTSIFNFFLYRLAPYCLPIHNQILAYYCYSVNIKQIFLTKKAPTARVGIAVGAILPFNPPKG